MTAAHPYPWRLIAPWYRWERQIHEESRGPKQSRPVFQKFDDPEFAKSFTRNPQRSLRFFPEVDRVNQTSVSALTHKLSGAIGSRFRTGPIRVPGTERVIVAKAAAQVPTDVRKLYLDVHKRYYLVVCELRCDAPGFPSPKHEQACEAGFVIRRRAVSYPPGARQEAAERVARVAALAAELAQLDGTVHLHGRAASRRDRKIRQLEARGELANYQESLRARHALERTELAAWARAKGVHFLHQGWLPSPFEGIGDWEEVEDEPEQLIERTHPLYPLAPDPLDPQRSAEGRALYFGVVPTVSLETDERGTPRFDPVSQYEIRCYVRRHDPNCPRGEPAPDCPGPLVWSEPSERYQVASPTDLIGTSQRPITIRLPDLTEMAAQLGSAPPANLAAMRVEQPQGLLFGLKDGRPTGGELGAAQICFFAIPLITIVAFFVFKLFLGIVVFLFGLFFLLQLRFCILPEVDLSIELQAAVDADPPEAAFEGSFDASAFGGVDLGTLKDQLATMIEDDIGPDPDDELSGKVDDARLDHLFGVARGVDLANEIDLEDPESAARVGPRLTACLEYETPVTKEIAVT